MASSFTGVVINKAFVFWTLQPLTTVVSYASFFYTTIPKYFRLHNILQEYISHLITSPRYYSFLISTRYESSPFPILLMTAIFAILLTQPFFNVLLLFHIWNVSVTCSFEEKKISKSPKKNLKNVLPQAGLEPASPDLMSVALPINIGLDKNA